MKLSIFSLWDKRSGISKIIKF